jgi:hypothetical protein
MGNPHDGATACPVGAGRRIAGAGRRLRLKFGCGNADMIVQATTGDQEGLKGILRLIEGGGVEILFQFREAGKGASDRLKRLRLAAGT